MTDYGKILNTEALDRIKLSQKLPSFRKQRRGTEVFIFDNRIMVSVYDDCPISPVTDNEHKIVLTEYGEQCEKKVCLYYSCCYSNKNL